jgi:hypothetical protein
VPDQQSGHFSGKRKSIAALCIVALTMLPACSRSPNSLFDKAGYYVRGDKVYYLEAFPGSTAEIAAADAATFQPLAGPPQKTSCARTFTVARSPARMPPLFRRSTIGMRETGARCTRAPT